MPRTGLRAGQRPDGCVPCPVMPITVGALRLNSADQSWRPPMAGNSTEAGRSVTNKITSILMTFTEGSEHSLTERPQLAGLAISTAHRLTSELASWRLLERTRDGMSRAGLPLRMMGAGDCSAPDLRERAPCVLEDLARVTRCRTRLGVLQELEVSYIEKQPGLRPVTAFVPAATLPAHPTALGRALLAFAPASTVEMTIMRGLRAYTPHTITAPDRFRRALAVVRMTRVAVTRFELEPTTCGVAVPGFGGGGGGGPGCGAGGVTGGPQWSSGCQGPGGSSRRSWPRCRSGPGACPARW